MEQQQNKRIGKASETAQIAEYRNDHVKSYAQIKTWEYEIGLRLLAEYVLKWLLGTINAALELAIRDLNKQFERLLWTRNWK